MYRYSEGGGSYKVDCIVYIVLVIVQYKQTDRRQKGALCKVQGTFFDFSKKQEIKKGSITIQII